MQEVFEKIVEKLEVAGKTELIAHGGRRNGKTLALGYAKGISEAIEIVKQAAEEYSNAWIPCSERMPDVPEGIEDDECPEFIVTIKGANKATTLKCASDGTWFDDLGYSYDVIAWQPLPALYQPKGE